MLIGLLGGYQVLYIYSMALCSLSLDKQEKIQSWLVRLKQRYRSIT